MSSNNVSTGSEDEETDNGYTAPPNFDVVAGSFKTRSSSRRPSVMSAKKNRKQSSKYDTSNIPLPLTVIASQDVFKLGESGAFLSLEDNMNTEKDSKKQNRKEKSTSFALSDRSIDYLKQAIKSPFDASNAFQMKISANTGEVEIEKRGDDEVESPIPTSVSSKASSVVDSIQNDQPRFGAVPKPSDSEDFSKRLSVNSSNSLELNSSVDPIAILSSYDRPTYSPTSSFARRSYVPPAKLRKSTLLSRPKSVRDSITGDQGEKISIRVFLPGDQVTTVRLGDATQMEHVLQYVCRKRNIDCDKHALFDMNKKPIELNITLEDYIAEKKADVVELILDIGVKAYTTMVEKDEDQETMIYQTRDNTLFIIAASESKLIEILTNVDITEDMEFLDIMLLTFRSFTSPLHFYFQLMDRFDCVLPDNPTTEDIVFYQKMKIPTQKRVISVINYWVQMHWQDFGLEAELKKELDYFIARLKKEGEFESECLNLVNSISIQSREFDSILASYIAAERKKKAMESMFSTLSAEDIGQQMSLYSYELFANIHPVEYLHEIWSPKKQGDEVSITPILNFFIKRFDQESYWVVTEILNERDLKKRIAVLKKVIKMTNICLENNNFFSLFSLYYGLQNNAISRLKKTWDGLSNKTKDTYTKLEKICDSSKNMKGLRDQLAKSSSPIIPFVPIYLKDLTFMNDGNPSKIRGMINFDKLRTMSVCVRGIANLAAKPYQFKAIPEILNFIKSPIVERDMNKLKALSKLCEPPTQ